MTANLAKLPPRAYVKNQHPDGSPIIPGVEAGVLCIMRGENGAYPLKTDITADGLNLREGVTPAQREAMLAGSMFGWDTPAANPDSYNEDGTLKPIAEADHEPVKSAAKLPKYVVYIQAGDPYGRNFVANFEVEGVTVRGRDREDVNTRADWLAAVLGAE